MNHVRSILLLYVIMAVVWAGLLIPASVRGEITVIYDCTLGSQLRDVPGSVRPVMMYHAYPWTPERFAEAVATAGDACCADCRSVCLDYEPWIIQSDNPNISPHLGSVDPHFADLESIQRRHQEYASAIAAATPKAKELGVRIGIYGYLSLGHRRLEDINQNGERYNTWLMEQDLVLRLPVLIDEKETTLLAVVDETGGAVWVPWYLPNSWNQATPGFVAKSVKVFTRQCAAIESAGGKATPLLCPTVAGGDDQVLPEIQTALIRAAQAHGAFGVWAKPGEVTDEFRNLLTEEVIR